MTVGASSDKNAKGVRSDRLPIQCVTGIIARSREMAVDAMDSGITQIVACMRGILDVGLMAASTQCVGVVNRSRFLCVNFVACRACDFRLSVMA